MEGLGLGQYVKERLLPSYSFLYESMKDGGPALLPAGILFSLPWMSGTEALRHPYHSSGASTIIIL